MRAAPLHGSTGQGTAAADRAPGSSRCRMRDTRARLPLRAGSSRLLGSGTVTPADGTYRLEPSNGRLLIKTDVPGWAVRRETTSRSMPPRWSGQAVVGGARDGGQPGESGRQGVPGLSEGAHAGPGQAKRNQPGGNAAVPTDLRSQDPQPHSLTAFVPLRDACAARRSARPRPDTAYFRATSYNGPCHQVRQRPRRYNAKVSKGSSSNSAAEINAVSGGDRVDQGLELGGWVLVRPGSPPPVEGDGGGEPGADGP
ncbi:hypothetical protein SAMN02787118_13430 [Streptomyces mirabilis]|uniref:Uncharacterized protein n=1 Tax=Streptomyces mirabilis TaxID=68239 RepID=A0A1I2VYJ8_9ACTN|nr:hypothetical protein SAMN02787118_13430 [Streptomyces mirabilis]